MQYIFLPAAFIIAFVIISYVAKCDRKQGQS